MVEVAVLVLRFLGGVSGWLGIVHGVFHLIMFSLRPVCLPVVDCNAFVSQSDFDSVLSFVVLVRNCVVLYYDEPYCRSLWLGHLGPFGFVD